MSGNRARLALAGVNLPGWSILLCSRDATPWVELEARRSHFSASGGISFSHSTAWGTPLFGREVGSCYREGQPAAWFLLVNMPAHIGSAMTYHVLELTQLSIALISFMTGFFALVMSVCQWLAIGLFWGAGRVW